MPIAPPKTNLVAMAKGNRIGTVQLTVTDAPYIRGTPKRPLMVETVLGMVLLLGPTAVGHFTDMSPLSSVVTAVPLPSPAMSFLVNLPTPVPSEPSTVRHRITLLPAGTPAKNINGSWFEKSFALLWSPRSLLLRTL